MPSLARKHRPPPSAVAFWKRNTPSDGKNRANNQTNIIDITQRLKRHRRKLPNKNKAGAPKGNRNAWRTGRYAAETTAQRRQIKREVREVLLQMRLLTAQYHALAAMKDAQTTQMLLDAGLTRRAIWLSEW